VSYYDLPDWNSLSNDERCELVKFAEDHCCACRIHLGGQYALDMYNKFRNVLDERERRLTRATMEGWR
jgi:hypothetical protein